VLRDAEYNALDNKHNQHVRPFFYLTQTLPRDSLYCTVLKRTSSTELDLGVPTDYQLGLLLCFKKKRKTEPVHIHACFRFELNQTYPISLCRSHLVCLPRIALTKQLHSYRDGNVHTDYAKYSNRKQSVS